MGMPLKTQAQMLNRLGGEIKELQATVAALAPKAEAYDLLKKVLGLVPGPSQGYGEDIHWVIRTELTKIEAEIAASEPQTSDEKVNKAGDAAN